MRPITRPVTVVKSVLRLGHDRFDVCLNVSKVVFAAFMLFIPDLARAALELVVRKEIQVFEENNDDAEVVRTLEKGDRIRISPKKYGKWRKVLVRVRGESQAAWVKASDLKGSTIRNVEGSETKYKPYHHRMGAGVSFAVSYMSQAARDYKDADGVTIPIAASSGVSTFLGLVFDYGLSDSTAVRGSLYYRSTNLTGKYTQTTGEVPFDLTQTLIGLNALMKFYFSPSGDFWVGAGGEFAKGIGVNLKIANSQGVSSAEYPNFFLVQGAAGIDLNMFGDVYIIPEIRVGMVLTTKPMMINGEGLVSLSYAF